MIDCYKKLRELDAKMTIQVHDELVFDVPKKNCESAASQIEKIMENVVSLKVPLKVDVEAGRNWLDTVPVNVKGGDTFPVEV